MQIKMPAWVYPPKLDAEEKTLVARAIHIICCVLLVCCLVGAWTSRTLAPMVVLDCGGVCLVIILCLNRRGWVQLSGVLLAAVLLAAATAILCVSGEGWHDVALLLFPAMIAVTGVLLDKSKFLLFIPAALLCVTGVAVAEIQGYLVPRQRVPTDYNDLMDAVLILLVTAITVWLLISNLRVSLARAREQAAALEASYEDLASQAERLRASEEKFRGIIEMAADAIFIAEPKRRIIKVNRRACELTGYSEAELTAMPFAELFPGKELEAAPLSYDLVEQGKNVVTERSILRKDGSTVVVEVSSQKMPDGSYQAFCRDITERKQAETALRESEVRFRSLVESSPQAIFVQSQGRFVYLNPAMLRLFGATKPEELLGAEFMERMAPEYREIVRVRIRFQQETGKRTPLLEEEYLRLDGSRFPVEVVAVPIRFQGAEAHLVLVLDITERKQAEAALRESEMRFRKIFEDGPLGMVIANPESGSFIGANSMFCRMLGYTEKELLQMTFFQVTHPEHREQDKEELKKLWAGQIPFYKTEKRYVRRNGEVIWAAVTAIVIHDANGNPLYALAMIEDITQRKRTEEERNRLFTLSLDMLCVANFDGRFQQVNPAWTKVLGWTEEELLDRPWLDFIHPEDRQATLAVADQLFAGKPVVGFENRYRCKIGAYRTLAWNSFPLPEEKLIFAVVRDVTELRNIETRLRQAEKMEAIGHLAGGVAHDFNNQLAGILGFAETLRGRLKDEELNSSVDAIRSCALRAAELTRQLLAFARKGRYQSVPVDTHGIIADVTAILERSIDKRIIIRRVLAARQFVAMGDPSQLHNALLNLAINACDAMPNGGELVFATDVVILGEEQCRGVPYEIAPGRYVQICVTDSGVGMAEDVKKHLFEPFFTTKQPGKGTGMGLAAVYGIVRNHKGAISVYSEVGHGSTFKIYLPVVEALAVPAKPSEAGVPARGSARILLVDDEALVLKGVSLAMRRLGYQVAECKDGAEAIELYRQKWREIDLVILDMIMPGLGAGEAFAAMRRINPEIKAILTSGYSINGQAQAILDQGVLGFVQKPFQIADLAKQVAAALSRPVKQVELPDFGISSRAGPGANKGGDKR